MTSLQKAIEIVLKQCMGLKAEEGVLILYDKNKKDIAKYFFEKAKNITLNAKLLKIPALKLNSEEPPGYVAKEMLKYKVIIITTTKSMSHTLARKNACDAGARAASMPGITKEIMERAIDIDYAGLKKINEKIAGILQRGRKIRITTAIGTDITADIRKEKIITDNGVYSGPKQWGNLPAGETAFAPLEGTANGIFFVDATMSGVSKKLSQPIKITVKAGFAVKIEGKGEAKELDALLKNLNDKNVYNIAEIGIGTNPKAKLSGITLEDEKVIGTAHIALGNNYSLGGKIKVPIHLDGVLLKPTIYIDGKKIMDRGKFLLG